MNVRLLKELVCSFRDGAGEEDLDTDEWEALGSYADDIHQLQVCLEATYEEWREYMDSMETGSSRLRLQSSQGYRAPFIRSSRPQPGRPRFYIGQDQLQYLSAMGFSWADVARLLGVSRMTVYRCRRQLGMTTDELSSISDEQLEQELITMRRDHPQYGESLVCGHLRSKGYRITGSAEQYKLQTPLTLLFGRPEVSLLDSPILSLVQIHCGISVSVSKPHNITLPWHVGHCFYYNFYNI